MDLVVKYRFFRSRLSGFNDKDAERIYRWHIERRSGARMQAGLSTDKWKRSIDDYVKSAVELLESMKQSGFRPDFPVPVDPNHELLNGSHRVACALALGIEKIPVEPSERFVWAPPWGYAWFVEHGMSASDLEHLKRSWWAMRQ